MALTELLSTLSVGIYGKPFPNAFTKPSGPGSTNGEPEDGTLFNDSDENGIPDRVIKGYTANGQFVTFATKEASYNKFNLRADSWNGNSLGLTGDQPFILRGLQRANSTEPQYWGGFPDTISTTPRGGMSTFVDRDAADKIRLTKFLASPKGIMYTAKQVGLQLTNPNVESFFGVPNPLPVPLTNKFYNPISPVYQNPLLGVRGRRDTLLPIDIGYRYEDIHKARAVGVQIAGAVGLNVPGGLDPSTTFNRLNLLRIESFPAAAAGVGGVIGDIATAAQGISSNISNSTFGLVSGLPFLTLTSTSGPKSMFGVGITPIRRYVNTGENATSGPLAQAGRRWATNQGIPQRLPGITAINDFRVSPTPIDPFTTLNFNQVSPEKYGTGKGGNIFERIGVQDLGKPGLIRANPKSAAGGSKPDNPSRDLVKFKITPGVSIDSAGPTGGTPISFRAYIRSISDNHSANYEDVGLYYNQSSTLVRYGGPKSRSITIDFAVASLTKLDQPITINKLNTLAKAISPTLASRNIVGPTPPVPATPTKVKLQIGGFLNTIVVIDSLSYDIDNETPWDIDKETPMVVNVSLSAREVNRSYYNGDSIKVIG